MKHRRSMELSRRDVGRRNASTPFGGAHVGGFAFEGGWLGVGELAFEKDGEVGAGVDGGFEGLIDWGRGLDEVVIRNLKVVGKAFTAGFVDAFLGEDEVVDEVPVRGGEFFGGFVDEDADGRVFAGDGVVIEEALGGGGVHAEPDVEGGAVDELVVMDEDGSDAGGFETEASVGAPQGVVVDVDVDAAAAEFDGGVAGVFDEVVGDFSVASVVGVGQGFAEGFNGVVADIDAVKDAVDVVEEDAVGGAGAEKVDGDAVVVAGVFVDAPDFVVGFVVGEGRLPFFEGTAGDLIVVDGAARGVVSEQDAGFFVAGDLAFFDGGIGAVLKMDGGGGVTEAEIFYLDVLGVFDGDERGVVGDDGEIGVGRSDVVGEAEIDEFFSGVVDIKGADLGELAEGRAVFEKSLPVPVAGFLGAVEVEGGDKFVLEEESGGSVFAGGGVDVGEIGGGCPGGGDGFGTVEYGTGLAEEGEGFVDGDGFEVNARCEDESVAGVGGINGGLKDFGF